MTFRWKSYLKTDGLEGVMLSEISQTEANTMFSFLLIYIFIFTVLGLHCCMGYSLVMVLGLLIVVTSLVEHGL